MGSDELSLRAGQLRSEKSRAHLVCALRGAVELADRQSDPLRVPPLPIRREIRENRALLLELAERLAADRPLTVKGVAMSSLLVYDGDSPLNSKAASRALATSAYTALVALGRGHPAANAADD
jgi:hypothetical protein